MELSAASEGPGLTSGEVAERIAAGRVNRSLNNDWRTWASIVRRNTLTLFNAGRSRGAWFVLVGGLSRGVGCWRDGPDKFNSWPVS